MNNLCNNLNTDLYLGSIAAMNYFNRSVLNPVNTPKNNINLIKKRLLKVVQL